MEETGDSVTKGPRKEGRTASQQRSGGGKVGYDGQGDGAKGFAETKSSRDGGPEEGQRPKETVQAISLVNLMREKYKARKTWRLRCEKRWMAD